MNKHRDANYREAVVLPQDQKGSAVPAPWANDIEVASAIPKPESRPLVIPIPKIKVPIVPKDMPIEATAPKKQ